MTPQISIAVLLALGVVGLACLLGPLIVQFVWARHRPWLWASFAYGALTFAVSQLLTRIPLITNVLPVLPEWQAILANAVLSAVILGFSAGLFEETGRLIVMGTFFRKRRTHADGVSFGLGHGGLEAGALVGLGMLSLAVLGLVVRSGGWANLAAGMPPEAAAGLAGQLGGLTVGGALLGGVERVAAMVLHVALSLLVLLGITRGRGVLAWLLAILVHGTVNTAAVLALTVAGLPAAAVEAGLTVVAVGLLVWIVRIRGLFEPDRLRVTEPSTTSGIDPTGSAEPGSSPGDSRNGGAGQGD